MFAEYRYVCYIQKNKLFSFAKNFSVCIDFLFLMQSSTCFLKQLWHFASVIWREHNEQMCPKSKCMDSLMWCFQKAWTSVTRLLKMSFKLGTWGYLHEIRFFSLTNIGEKHPCFVETEEGNNTQTVWLILTQSWTMSTELTLGNAEGRKITKPPPEKWFWILTFGEMKLCSQTVQKQRRLNLVANYSRNNSLSSGLLARHFTFKFKHCDDNLTSKYS